MQKEKEEQNNLAYKDILPAMNVAALPPQQEDLISNDAMLGIYAEILDQIKNDRTEINGCIAKFSNFVFNDGDATTASKEALVNLIKLKAEAADKMSRVADLMTRVKLKERDTFPRYLSAKQENTIHIGSNSTKRALLQAINKAKTQKEEDNV